MIKQFLLSTALIAAHTSYASECESLTRLGKDIIFYGDTHGYHTNTRLAEHLKSEYNKEDLALFVHLGDIKNYGEEDLGYFFSRYKFLLDDNNGYSKEDKNVFVLGNHDFTDSLRVLEELRSKFKKERESFAENELIKITSDDGKTKAWLITLNTKHLDEDKSYIYQRHELEEQITRFTHCIQRDDIMAPLFLVSHEGYHDTHSLPSDVKKWFTKGLPKLLRSEFPKRPVIAFNGHKHHYVQAKRFDNVSFVNAPRAGAEKHKGGRYGYITCNIDKKECILRELSSKSIYDSDIFNF